MPFDPELGPGTPGFEGTVQTFQPSCPEDLPIGRLALAREVLRARAGRPVTVELRWRHPRGGIRSTRWPFGSARWRRFASTRTLTG